MMYVQFYARNLKGELDEAVGDRSVIIVDGRMSSTNIGSIAEAECLKRGYEAWRVFSGESFTRSSPVSQLWYAHKPDPVRDPVWLRAHD